MINSGLMILLSYDRRMPAPDQRADRRGDHLIVCGDGPLAYRIAEELTSRYNPGLRLVLAIFNRRLGDHIRLLFPDCTVLSGTAMSAPP